MSTIKEYPAVAAASVSSDVPTEYCEAVTDFFKRMGDARTFKPQHSVDDSFSNLIGGALKNAYGGMHGGAVGAVAERVAIACARTVVGADKDLFLGELGLSYLSAAPHNAEVIIDGNVMRSGRNLTVVAVNFRLKESGRLAFLTRATFYNMPVSSL
ncbi:hypothetical protein AAHA92_23035 [Salvia divinorum]|uniref:Thioesterase domain-containing protein n=1 Tax=Salvia divinorum TaxID=28513 RepID=A0ABD1GTH7_SALDI